MGTDCKSALSNAINPRHRGYSKIENDQQDISIDTLIYLSKHFIISLDDIVSFNNSKIPNEISLEDKATSEQLQLINELDPEEKIILLKLIETFVSKKRFKDYLQQNIANL